jgi:hypothetical protein
MFFPFSLLCYFSALTEVSKKFLLAWLIGWLCIFNEVKGNGQGKEELNIGMKFGSCMKIFNGFLCFESR